MTIVTITISLYSDSILAAVFGTLQFFYNHSEVSCLYSTTLNCIYNYLLF